MNDNPYSPPQVECELKVPARVLWRKRCESLEFIMQFACLLAAFAPVVLIACCIDAHESWFPERNPGPFRVSAYSLLAFSSVFMLLPWWTLLYRMVLTAQLLVKEAMHYL